MRPKLILSGVAVVAFAAIHCASEPASAQAERPTFEVASIRPSTPDGSRASVRPSPPDRFTVQGMPLEILLRIAYGFRAEQMAGVPDWVRPAAFDINAKIPEGVAQDQVPLMLQALLEDRFNLESHTEFRESEVFALVFARNDQRLGPNLKISETDCGPIREVRDRAIAEARERGDSPEAITALVRAQTKPEPGAPQCATQMSTKASASGAPTVTIRAQGMELATLMDLLRSRSERPVVDRTGLSGTFDFELTFSETNPAYLAGLEAGRARAGSTPGPAASGDAALPTGSPVPSASIGDTLTVPQALQEQLGLKLEPATAPVEILVIDRVEPPTPN